ncbi:MAG: universal stress protein E [Glaciecola sp.]|jgi:universal stress protein E
MFTCKKILAVVDPKSEEQTSLQRALSIADKTGAQIVALSCIYDKSYDMAAVLTSDERFNMKQAMMEQAKLKLEALVKQFKCESKVEILVTWEKKLHDSVVNTCNELACDLIIKSTKKHGLLSSSIFTPNDWHILRKSPVSVLLVKSHDWPEEATIVASLGVSARDDTHVSLSDKVAENAHALSDLLNAEVHFANSYAGAPLHIAVEVPNFSPEVYNKSVEERHIKKVQELGQKYQLEEANIHVLEGLPEDIIPEICKKNKATLLVIGSVGRQGLSAALLGNTAELIIDAVECDTLVVKPD